MPLDRTWYNTLVDDNGSGLTGTIWDKHAVNVLMTTVDQELVWVGDQYWTAYTPGLYATAGVWSGPTVYAKYQYHGRRTVLLQFSIEGSALSAATAEVMIALPVVAAAWDGMACNPCMITLTVNELVLGYIGANKTVLTLTRMGGQAFPATGALYVRGQIFYTV